MNNSLNYIRYHMNRDRNFLILYGIALLCLFPLLALALKTILPPKDSVIVMLILLGATQCCMAMILPLYLFHFLWNCREMDLYVCIAMKRKTLFIHKFLLGLLYLLVPTCLAFTLNMGILSIRFDQPYFALFAGKISTLMVLLYSFNVWIAVRCNSFLDAGVMVVCYFIVPIMLILALKNMFSSYAYELLYCQSYSVLYESLISNPLIRWIGSVLTVSSAGLMLIIEMTSKLSHVGMEKDFTYMHLLPSGVWIVWLAIALIFFFAARRIFIAKKMEDAQTPSRSFFMYPMIIICFTLAMMLFSSDLNMESLFAPNIIASVFIYFLFWFVAQRKIKINWKQIAVLAVLLVLVMSSRKVFLMTNGFGMVDEKIPEDVQKMRVSFVLAKENADTYYLSCMSNELETDKYGEEVEALLRLQDQVIEDVKETRPEEVDWETSELYEIDIEFTFEVDKGEQSRYYTLFTNDKQLFEQYLSYVNSLKSSNLIQRSEVHNSAEGMSYAQ